VFIPVSLGNHYTGRAGIGHTGYCGSEDINSTLLNSWRTWSRGVIDPVHRDITVSNLSYFLWPRTHIHPVIIDIRVTDHRSVINDIDYPRASYIIIINPLAGNIGRRRANPVAAWDRAYRKAQTNSRPQRCPTIIFAAVAPAYPCRSPLVSGYPFPSVVIIITPSAVVEGCPSPGIIRNPGCSVVGINPVPICGIGPETRTGIRYPDISVFRVFYPSAIRGKLIVKILESNIGTVLRL